jgi:hypothetical protein
MPAIPCYHAGVVIDQDGQSVVTIRISSDAAVDKARLFPAGANAWGTDLRVQRRRPGGDDKNSTIGGLRQGSTSLY